MVAVAGTAAASDQSHGFRTTWRLGLAGIWSIAIGLAAAGVPLRIGAAIAAARRDGNRYGPLSFPGKRDTGGA